MTPSLNHQWSTSRYYSIKGDQATACSLGSQDHGLSSGVPLWQSSVTPPCCPPHWARHKEKRSLSTGECTPLHPVLSPCSFSPPGDRKVGGGWNEGPVCLHTGGSRCWYAALCLPPALIPAHISISEREGKAAVCPSELQPSGCLPLGHTNIPKWWRSTGSWCSGNTHFECVGAMSDIFKERACPKVAWIRERIDVDNSLKRPYLKYCFISGS